jgi:hypothetical protein
MFQEDRARQSDDGTRLHRRRNMIRLLYLGNPPGAVARQDIERIWQFADAGEMEAALRALLEAGKLPGFLDRMDDLIAQLPAQGDVLFWPALSRVLTRSNDWMTSPAPEYSLVDDAATMLARLALRDHRHDQRVKTAMEALIAAGDLAIAPWIVRKQMSAHGLSTHSRGGRGDSIYSRSETLDLIGREIPRYREAIIDGTALRRLPNVEAIYVIANYEAWDEDLRMSLTGQLVGRDALATMGALLLPPGHLTELDALAELFDPVAVRKALGEIDFTDPALEPWIDSAVQQFRSILAGGNGVFDVDEEENDDGSLDTDQSA